MNYYDVLEVPYDATEEQINKSYKRLALKYHPDKYKLDGGERFKKINEAYQVLHDIEKRKMYDAIYNDDTLRHNDISGNNSIDFSSIISILISLILKIVKKDNHNIQKKTNINQKKDIHLNINVELESVYNGEIKKITIHTKRLNGEKKIKNIYIPLYDIQDEYIFKNEGDEYEPDKFTDIKITVNIISHPTIHRDRILNDYDLYIDTTMTLYEFYTGIDKTVPFFNTNIHVKCDPQTIFSHKDCIGYFVCHIEPKKGLPYTDKDKDTNEINRGDLLIYFRLILPSLSEIDINSISTIKDIFK